MQNYAILVKQSIKGNERAFQCLILEYQSGIYNLIISKVNDPEDAKDLVQEVFFEAYKGLSSLKSHERFYQWLCQIARHQCYNFMRKKRGNSFPLKADIISSELSTDELLILKDNFARIMHIINQLPEIERELLKARYLEDASYAELQAKHKLSYKVVTMRLFRAIRRVREQAKHLFSATLAISWHNILKRTVIWGGMETMKTGIKIKIITAGVAIMLISGTTGVLLKHFRKFEPSESSNIQVTHDIPPQSSTDLNRIKDAVEITMDESSPVKIEKLENKEENALIPSEPLADETTKKTDSSESEQSMETLLERYERITTSPEFSAKVKELGGTFAEQRNFFTGQVKFLRQEKELLEDKIANASDEERNQIENEMGKVQDEYMEAKINESKYQILWMEAFDRAKLSYFTTDELGEIFSQKYAPKPGSTPPPMPQQNEREMEEIAKVSSEARKRLKADGFMPNSYTARMLFW